MLFVGARGMDDNGISAANAEHYSHPEGRMSGRTTGLYGFANGFWGNRLLNHYQKKAAIVNGNYGGCFRSTLRTCRNGRFPGTRAYIF